MSLAATDCDRRRHRRLDRLLLAASTDRPHVVELVPLIDADAGIALTDAISARSLHGLRDEHTDRRVDTRLAAFDMLQLRANGDYRDAAALYRHARSKGKTIVRRTRTVSS